MVGRISALRSTNAPCSQGEPDPRDRAGGGASPAPESAAPAAQPRGAGCSSSAHPTALPASCLLRYDGAMSRFKDIENDPAGTSRAWSELRAHLRTTADGLLPAIAQQHDSGEVLMLAWMNDAALDETLRTGRVCYWSRSRGRLWRKGESSGQVQRLVEARIDCDGDTLLLRVDQRGPACHTGRRSCFFHRIDGDAVIITADPLADPRALYAAAPDSATTDEGNRSA